MVPQQLTFPDQLVLQEGLVEVEALFIEGCVQRLHSCPAHARRTKGAQLVVLQFPGSHLAMTDGVEVVQPQCHQLQEHHEVIFGMGAAAATAQFLHQCQGMFLVTLMEPFFEVLVEPFVVV